MSTVVFRGLQSCLESQPVEMTTLRLKLATPKPHFSESINGIARGHGAAMELKEKGHYEQINHMSSDLGGWSFLQALSNASQTPKEAWEKQSSYVPPTPNRSSSSTLSQRSLELCTESLGCETGTHITESSSLFSISTTSDMEAGKTPKREQPKSVQHVESKKIVNSRNFPPPLTTISGSNPIQVRPHREGGRLIIKTVEAPSTQAYLQAERSHGRLQLWILKDCYSTTATFDSLVAAEEIEGNREETERDGFESDTNDGGEGEEIEDKQEEGEEIEDSQEEESCDIAYVVEEDTDGKNIDVGVEMGMEKLQRPSRCKEGGRGNEGYYNWEPFWVAT